METVLLPAGTLTRFIVIKSTYYWGQGYAHRNDAGSVRLGEQDVFSPLVKIEAERATSNDKYVNLRFCYSNRYWAQKANDKLIVAESNQPEEDTSKSSCTLFEAVQVSGGEGWFYLNHVQSGGRLMFDTSMNFYVNSNPEPDQGYLSFANWETFVKLPKRVAFKGSNGSYLQAIWQEEHPYQQYSSGDQNAERSGYEVHLMSDGHVRIYSLHFTSFWRGSPTWIWSDSTDTTPNNKATLFWPVKIDDATIALRNVGNNKFCKPLTTEGKTNCLNAGVDTITNEARIGVQELVSQRKIHNVRYRMEDSRIFNETPYVAGTTTAYNYSDSEAGIAVEIGYEDSKSYSFSRSLSLTAGVTTTIEVGVPLISGASISVGYQINTTLEWNDTTTTTKSAKATGTVPVPPRSFASVNYVATMGTCDVPFSYTQQDTSSTDGSINEDDYIDGIFRGVNAYNFSFVIDKTQPLS